jgi:hypothetical protein
MAVFLGLGSIGLLACTLAEIPPHYPICDPTSGRTCYGNVPPEFQCKTIPEGARLVPIKWDLKEPFDRIETGVLAKEAQVDWAPQADTFPFDPNDHLHQAVPIGGDYWADTTYPVAPAGLPWISSGFKRGDGTATLRSEDEKRNKPGEIYSDWFSLEEKQFLHLLVGGQRDGDKVRVEIVGTNVIVHPPGTDRMHATIPDLPRGVRLKLRAIDQSPKAHLNVAAYISSDPTNTRDAVPVWGFADYHTHPTGHLAFGGLQGIHTFWGAPGRGVRDYQGNHPDPRFKQNIARDIPPCGDPHMPFNSHHGGFAAATILAGIAGRVHESLADLSLPNIADQHGSRGGPGFEDFPDFRYAAHETYHITQIHRAYLGGMRLVSALAMQTRAYEYAAGWVTCGDDGKPTVKTTMDTDIIRAHVEVMRELAKANESWMKIAYTPEEARGIIESGKLAIVLGVEVDQLGELTSKGRPLTVEEEIEMLLGLGIRHVVVVHAADNVLGGAAAFEDFYNTANDWMNREPTVRDHVEPLSGILDARGPFGDTGYFQLESAPADGASTIRFRLGDPLRAVLSDVFPHAQDGTHKFSLLPGLKINYGILHPLVNQTSKFNIERGPYDSLAGGHRNARGLTSRGQEYVVRLMQHGMLVDFAHASENTLERGSSLAIRSTLAKGADPSGLRDGILKTAEDKGCGGYPFMVSHLHFRSLAMKADYSDRASVLYADTADLVAPMLAKVKRTDPSPSMTSCIRLGQCDPRIKRRAVLASEITPLGPGSTSSINVATEYQISDRIAAQIMKNGGAFGVFLGQYAEDSGPVADLPFANDCAGSSKGFAVAYWYAQQLRKSAGGPSLPSFGLGIASDLLVVSGVAPRFGENACAAYLGSGAGSAVAGQLLETLVNPDQFRFEDQKSPVTYTEGTTTCSGTSHSIGEIACAPNTPLVPYKMGDRTYDFNVDGLPHIGLEPDMLQDVHNILNPEKGPHHQDLSPLFQSAEGYLKMWEKARLLADCGQSEKCDAEPARLTGADTCGDACPNSWNGGAPLEQVAEIYAACDAGKAVYLTQTEKGPHNEVMHMSRRDGQLQRQGDWAVFRTLPRQLWRCGGGALQSIGCPVETNYIKVRRVLDAQIGDVEDCRAQPLRPAVGNRRVVFQCLVGPPESR